MGVFLKTILFFLKKIKMIELEGPVSTKQNKHNFFASFNWKKIKNKHRKKWLFWVCLGIHLLFS
jgi:hypothetical protein